MRDGFSIELDGKAVTARPGETVLEVASRAGVAIPTLCHDPRLDPAGACRACLVEVEGQRRLAPACATPVAQGMVVRANSQRVARHQRALFALYLADHPDETDAPDSEVHRLAEEVGAPRHWPRLGHRRGDRSNDENAFIHFDASRCILCAQCTRYCDEVEAVQAITLAGRGPETTITTADSRSLLDSTCEMCGGCIDVCPTGALVEKLPLAASHSPIAAEEVVRTTCNYCGVGCQMDLHIDPGGHDGRGAVTRVTAPPPGTSRTTAICV